MDHDISPGEISEGVWCYDDDAPRASGIRRGHLVRREADECTTGAGKATVQTWCSRYIPVDSPRAPYSIRCTKCSAAVSAYVERSLVPPPERVVETVTLMVERDVGTKEVAEFLTGKVAARIGWSLIASETRMSMSAASPTKPPSGGATIAAVMGDNPAPTPDAPPTRKESDLMTATDHERAAESVENLSAVGVVRVFDADTGRLRPFAAGTVDEVARLREDLDDLRVQRDSARRVRDELAGARIELGKARARIERAWSLVNNYHGLGVPAGMLADALGAPLDDAGDVPAVEPTPDDPTPGPVGLATTPGSVASTRFGGRYILTGDTDSQPWFGPGKYVSADELLALGVVGQFDAGTEA